MKPLLLTSRSKMCFIQVGQFNKIVKKQKKSYTPVTSQDISNFYKVLSKETGIGKMLDVVSEHANPTSISQRMINDDMNNRNF